MTKYDETFDPPAPVALVGVRNIETNQRLKEIPMLLDTGADVSLLPNSVVEKLKIEPLKETLNLAGFDDKKQIYELYELQIVFSGKRFTGKFCVFEDEMGILGRDVLNQVTILFDGKNLTWQEISEELLEKDL